MPTKTNYDRAFYSEIQGGSRESARQVVPTLIELLKPKSVVDVGCGVGSWLSVFVEQGVTEILGLDGDYVERTALQIPADRFIPVDLTNPLGIGQRFDLVLSLEVAEHLPAHRASVYIENLLSLGDVIAFSAAIPNQGGTDHINEQWPEYWKALFEARGFVLIDCLRPRFWDNRDIERWYRQNLVLYVKKEYLALNLDLQREFNEHRHQLLSVVHPASYLAPSFGQLLSMIPRSFMRGIKRRFSRPSSPK